MNKFIAYYRSLTPSEKQLFAEKLGTTVPYLYQLVNGQRQAGAKILLRIGYASDGELTPEDVRPSQVA